MKKNKHLRKLLCTVIVIAVLVGAVATALFVDSLRTQAEEIDLTQAQTIVNEALDSLPGTTADTIMQMLEGKLQPRTAYAQGLLKVYEGNVRSLTLLPFGAECKNV